MLCSMSNYLSDSVPDLDSLCSEIVVMPVSIWLKLSQTLLHEQLDRSQTPQPNDNQSAKAQLSRNTV